MVSLKRFLAVWLIAVLSFVAVAAGFNTYGAKLIRAVGSGPTVQTEE